jgi:hypothetical protein
MVNSRVVNSFALFILIVSLTIETSVASPASATTVPTMCTPGDLAVSLLKVATGASTVGSVAFYLPIKITNTGATCSIGGIPRITPAGISVKSRAALNALPTSSKFKNFTLKKGQSAYSILGYWWTTSVIETYREQWLKSCNPVKAIGFDITITPRHNLLNRRVKYALPEVCTTGRANMSITPLSLTLF